MMKEDGEEEEEVTSFSLIVISDQPAPAAVLQKRNYNQFPRTRSQVLMRRSCEQRAALIVSFSEGNANDIIRGG